MLALRYLWISGWLGLQFGEQRLGAAEPRRAEHHRRAERGDALGDPGIGHLEPRGGADRPVDDAPVDPPVAQHRGFADRRPRGVDRRAVAGARRAADDAAIDELGAGRRDDRRDPLGGLRADRVAIDIDRLFRRARSAPGPAARARLSASPGGRIDRKKSAPSSNSRSPGIGFMPAARARSALAALRPDSRVRTSAPLSCSRLPTPAPMLPCAMIATTMPMPDLIRKISVERSLRVAGLARNAADAHPLRCSIRHGERAQDNQA